MKWGITSHDQKRSNLDFFRNEIDNFFDNFFPAKPGDLFANEWVPTVDVVDNGKTINVKADIPGLSEKDIELLVENNKLVISGEKNEEKKSEDSNKRYLISERRFGSFRRVISLPENTLADEIKAEFKNGVLTIEIPKKEKDPVKKIEIKTH